MNIEDLWDQFHQPLKTYISQRVNDQSIVDDLLQIVFMKIQVHLPNLIDEQKIDSWIYRITRNTIIDFYRTKKQAKYCLMIYILITVQRKKISPRKQTVCIRSTIKRLPEKYREALELTEFQGLSQKELSEKLGISYSGAKSRVQRGRGKLKQPLEGCCHIEADRYGNIVDFRILKE